MAERGSRKIPVTDRQFLWVQDDDKGEVILHVGPTMVSPTAADRVVIDDGNGGFREDPSGQPQRMVELSDAQYAVLYNPLIESEEEGPNGKFRPGRNESRELRNGTRNMIPGPCSFYLRPGQRVEIRDAHELASNQYLVVKVYGEVDENAPYYVITAKSATITTATAEEVAGGSGGSEMSEAEIGDVSLTRGQLIVIRGLDTQFYIPPTGVDVVPDLSVDNQGKVLNAAAARRILSSMPAPAAALPVPPPPPTEISPQAVAPPGPAGALPLELAEAAEGADKEVDEARRKRRREKPMRQARYAKVEQAARVRHQAQRPPLQPEPTPSGAGQPRLSSDEIQQLLASDVHRRALEREVRKMRLIRQAVVLSEKEFCVIIDADGKRQIKRGPARVFPGPYDSFMTKGSRDRIYDAYELLPQRALWLRFIAPIARDKLAALLPRGVHLDTEVYQPGDEFILTGVNSFFFPFNEVEILHPLNGQPHVGNDHSEIFIEAIGIDQKSGIYVRDLATGEVRTVRGKQSYLVDPRKEVHITRTISSDDWNLWIALGEPHKLTDEPVTTPWAISITVPHNNAVLATSADGQRVIEGPCVELLEYEETLVPMALSTGRPKSARHPLRTCFLRTVGNRVSDMVTLETADFVKVDAEVSYQVNFDLQFKDRWFNHENYVGVLCDHLRSLVRSRARQMALNEIWPNISSVIRDAVLGEKTAEGRQGRLFDENGMRVTEVEVLSSEILDKEIAVLLESVQRESVALVIGDRQISEQLRSEKLRHDIERERQEMKREATERKASLDELLRKLTQEAGLAELRGREATEREAAELAAGREQIILDSTVAREKSQNDAHIARQRDATTAKVDMNRLAHEEEQAYRQALTNIEMQRIEVQSKATVAERQAIQPALVEALTALGDKIMLGEVARNMNLVSLFKGKDIAHIFADVLGGTKLGRTIAAQLPKKPDNDGGDGV